MRFKIFLGLALASGIQLGCDSNSSSSNNPTVEPADASAGGTPVPGPAAPTPGGGETPTPGNPTTDVGGLVGGLRLNQNDLFRQLGDGIARQNAKFAASTVTLGQAIESYCQNPVSNNKAPVQAAWKETMLVWEELELFQVGPIAKNEKELKTAIYGWPQQTNTCRIDEEAIKASKNAYYTLPINTNRKGLQGIEYLVFTPTLMSACSAASATTKEWNALTPDARAQARCAYLKPLAAELQANATTLTQVWGTEGNNYLTSVIGNAAAEKAALQSLYENLFYLDIEVKNYKLATPAGHDPMFCPNSPAPCVGKDEFPLSGISREAIQSNIKAFTNLIYGFEDANQKRPGGFAALVRDIGGTDVATRSEALTRDLSAVFANQDASLSELIAAQKAENCEQSQISILCQLRKSIKEVSNELKYEYSKLLALTVPAGPQGDND
jgi:predicted lipoprotein